MSDLPQTETAAPKPAEPNLSTMRIHPPLLAAVLFVATLALHFMLPEARTVAWHHAAGLLLVAGGTALMMFAAATFEARDTTLNPYGDPTEFVVRRPYNFSRNPMYLGWTALLLGLAVFTESFVMLLAPAVFAAIIDAMVIPNEERTLENRFGQSYLDYKGRVRRWL